MLVELKNGETLNGHLVTCDNWMNLILKEVVQTNPVSMAFQNGSCYTCMYNGWNFGHPDT